MFLKDWEKRQEENRARQLQVRSSDMQHSSSRRRNVEVFILEEDHVYIRTRSSFTLYLGLSAPKLCKENKLLLHRSMYVSTSIAFLLPEFRCVRSIVITNREKWCIDARSLTCKCNPLHSLFQIGTSWTCIRRQHFTSKASSGSSVRYNQSREGGLVSRPRRNSLGAAVPRG